jgi:CRP-like cAMP-binding protein
MQAITKTYKKSTHLFHEKDHSRELYIVQSGCIRVFRKIGSREVDLARLSKGAVLGEMALIDGKPRSASAVSTEDTTVIMIDADTFDKRIIQGVPSWFLSMIRSTSEKIRKANTRLEALQTSSHCLHIVLALRYYFLRYGTSTDGRALKSLGVSETVSQLIQLLSVSYQCIMQILDMLQKKGITDIKNGRIMLLDQAKLDGCCDFLRLFFRKAFDKTGTVSDRASTLVRGLQTAVASPKSTTEKGLLEIAAADMATACEQSAGKGAGSLDLVNELKELEIVSFTKQPAAKGEAKGDASKSSKEGDAASGSPFAGYQFFIDPAMYGKFLLYCTYKDMAPAL